MSMNTDQIVGGMTAAEALTMATKCLAKLDAEQLAVLAVAAEDAENELNEEAGNSNEENPEDAEDDN